MSLFSVNFEVFDNVLLKVRICFIYCLQSCVPFVSAFLSTDFYIDTYYRHSRKFYEKLIFTN